MLSTQSQSHLLKFWFGLSTATFFIHWTLHNICHTSRFLQVYFNFLFSVWFCTGWLQVHMGWLRIWPLCIPGYRDCWGCLKLHLIPQTPISICGQTCSRKFHERKFHRVEVECRNNYKSQELPLFSYLFFIVQNILMLS